MLRQKEQQIELLSQKKVLIGNRIPKDFFVTAGIGESDITIHAGSYHLALKDAGIERCNIMTYSSILPAIAQKVEKNTDELVHGSVMETIMAVAHAEKGRLATAGVIFGWLYDKKTGEKYGGLVCERSGSFKEDEVVRELQSSLNELYVNGFSENFDLKGVEAHTRSFVPKKKFGTALIALCFKNYEVPLLGNKPIFEIVKDKNQR